MSVDAKTAASARKFAAEIMAEPSACSPELVDLAEHYLDLLSALNAIDALEVMEINPSNYDHDLVCELSGNASQAACIARDALAALSGIEPGEDEQARGQGRSAPISTDTKGTSNA